MPIRCFATGTSRCRALRRRCRGRPFDPPAPHAAQCRDFSRMVGALGIGDGDTVVVYDATDLLGGARAWWMFKHYGVGNVHLLEGGWRAWQASDLPVERGESRRTPRVLSAQAVTRKVGDAGDVHAMVQSGGQVVDARAAARFAGSVPEPRRRLAFGSYPRSPATCPVARDRRSAADVCEVRRRSPPPSARPVSTWRSPVVARAADPASRPPCCCSGWSSSGSATACSTTAPGRSGVPAADLPIETGPAPNVLPSPP